MTKIYVTGTCPNCNSRYRLDAKEVMKARRITCQKCDFYLGTLRLKTLAELLLKENKK